MALSVPIPSSIGQAIAIGKHGKAFSSIAHARDWSNDFLGIEPGESLDKSEKIKHFLLALDIWLAVNRPECRGGTLLFNSMAGTTSGNIIRWQ